jgi:putative redox protein
MSLKYPSNIIVENQGGIYTTHINAMGHELLSDEPEELGGKNEGPTAHQLLLSSLGSCTAITLRMYANRKEWDLRRVIISLNMEKVQEDGIEKTIIYRKVEMEGNLNDEQRDRLLQIADKCPVHKTLTSPILIRDLPD